MEQLVTCGHPAGYDRRGGRKHRRAALCREHEVAITPAIESGSRAWWLEAIFDQEVKGPYLVPKRGDLTLLTGGTKVE